MTDPRVAAWRRLHRHAAEEAGRAQEALDAALLYLRQVRERAEAEGVGLRHNAWDGLCSVNLMAGQHAVLPDARCAICRDETV